MHLHVCPNCLCATTCYDDCYIPPYSGEPLVYGERRQCHRCREAAVWFAKQDELPEEPTSIIFVVVSIYDLHTSEILRAFERKEDAEELVRQAEDQLTLPQRYRKQLRQAGKLIDRSADITDEGKYLVLEVLYQPVEETHSAKLVASLCNVINAVVGDQEERESILDQVRSLIGDKEQAS